MSCVEVMYQPYGASFPYSRSATDAVQAFGVPRMHEPLDLGSYPGPSTSSTIVKDEDSEREIQPKETHYLNANCVLLTYFSGDISTVVDDHFSRALSQTSGGSFGLETTGSKTLSCKEPSPWAQRNFPPSFWNSSYQPASSLMSSHHDFQFSSNPYLASSLHGITGLHQDPWHYSLSSQPHGVTYPHRPMHYDLSYPSMASTSRFSQNYGTLFMQPSMRTNQFSAMSGQCDISKASEHTRSRFGDHRLGSDFAAAHTALTGLESSISEAGKDLYWF
ncbi:hypothetical protein SNE40_018566 [Patella caerulea]|uniref:Transcription cofactor vestigial-like protein 2 n=1 Tax=Patella caerulea TaxID=87958 RepID=A0AAN8J7M9_PATCE